MNVMYALLTQVIIILGRIRDRFFIGYIRSDKLCASSHIPRPKQPEMNGVPFTHGSCCDCGAHKPRFFDLPATRATDKMLEDMIALKKYSGYRYIRKL